MLRGKKRTTSGRGISYRTMGDGTNLGSVQPTASTRVREATGRKHARCTQKRNNNDNASLAESRTPEGTMPSSSELLTRRDIPSLVGEIVNYLSVGNGPPHMETNIRKADLLTLLPTQAALHFVKGIRHHPFR